MRQDANLNDVLAKIIGVPSNEIHSTSPVPGQLATDVEYGDGLARRVTGVEIAKAVGIARWSHPGSTTSTRT
jgi:hypothetical protein